MQLEKLHLKVFKDSEQGHLWKRPVSTLYFKCTYTFTQFQFLFTDLQGRFTTVPLQALSDPEYMRYSPSSIIFIFNVSQQRWISVLCLKQWRKLVKFNTIKWTICFHYWSDKQTEYCWESDRFLGARAAVVHLNFRAGSICPVLVLYRLDIE